MTETQVAENEVTPTEVEESEEETLTAEQVAEIFAANPMLSGMWEGVAPSVPRLAELSEALKKVTVTEKEVTDAINGSTVKSVVSERNEIAEMEKALAAKKEALRNKVRDVLKGSDMSKEDEEKARAEFATEKDKVVSFANVVQKIFYSGGDDGSDVYAALEFLKTKTPSLRGVAKSSNGRVTSGESTAMVREWLRVNRPDIKTGEKGRLSAEALEAYRAANHPGNALDSRKSDSK